MADASHIPDDFEDLLTVALLGVATKDEIQRINTLLSKSEELRRRAVHFLQDDCLLREECLTISRVANLHDPLSPDWIREHLANREGENTEQQPASPPEAGGSASTRHGGQDNVRLTSLPRRLQHWLQANSTYAVIAAVLVVAVATSLLSPGPSDRLGKTSTTNDSDDSVAYLLELGEVAWDDGAAGREHRAAIRVGDKLELKSGVVVLPFECGAEVCLKGPASFEVLSPTSASLEYGTLTAYADENARGFRVDTPSSQVTDLGTQFGLAVDTSGVTDVIVFEGSVALQYMQPSLESSVTGPSSADPGHEAEELQGRILQVGEGLRVCREGSTERLLAVNDFDFPFATDTSLPKRGDPALIVAVSDNLRIQDTAKCYRIISNGLREDAQAYVDRIHEWNGPSPGVGIPSALLGADYVMPFNDDRFVTNLEVDVTLGAPARLYIFVDHRLPLPRWIIDGFQDTGWDIGIDESRGLPDPNRPVLGVGPGDKIDQLASVWYVDVEEPTTVRLGAFEKPQRRANMYGIAAVPLATARKSEAGHGPAAFPSVLPSVPNSDAEVLVERVWGFSDLTIATPSPADLASASNKCVFFVESVGGQYPPHDMCLAPDGTFPQLNDGMVSRNGDDPERNAWHDGQGRFCVSLPVSTPITEINAFSWHHLARASQFLTVWGSDSAEPPELTFASVEEATSAGWDHIARVDSRPLGRGGVHASSIRSTQGSFGPYRHIAWVSEKSDNEGTFFCEIDILTPAEAEE